MKEKYGLCMTSVWRFHVIYKSSGKLKSALIMHKRCLIRLSVLNHSPGPFSCYVHSEWMARQCGMFQTQFNMVWWHNFGVKVLPLCPLITRPVSDSTQKLSWHPRTEMLWAIFSWRAGIRKPCVKQILNFDKVTVIVCKCSFVFNSMFWALYMSCLSGKDWIKCLVCFF